MRQIQITLLTIATTVICMIGATAGTAAADSDRLLPHHATSVSSDGTTITSVLSNATFRRTSDGVEIVDRSGRPVDGIADVMVLDGTPIAMRTQIAADGRSATLRPDLTADMVAQLAHNLHPVSAKKERALENMVWHIANGLNRAGTVGALAGTAAGAVVGGLVGLIAGCAVVAGCVWLGALGVVGGAAVGGVIGGVVGIGYGDPRAGQAVLDWLRTP